MTTIRHSVFYVWLLVVGAACLVAPFTLPAGRVSVHNMALRDDATYWDTATLAVGLPISSQRIDDYGVFKIAVINEGEHEFRLIGLPFVGKYYRL